MPANIVVTRINKQLKAQGREERLVRSPAGYYYLTIADTLLPEASIYVYRLGPEDYEFAAREVIALFAAGGVNVTFEGVQ